jgi:hypothetical protein
MIILRGKFKWQDIVDASSLDLDLDSLQRQLKETTAKDIYTLSLIVLFIFLLALLIFLIYRSLTITLIILSPIFMLALLGIALLYILLDRWRARRIARQLFSQDKGLQYEYEFVISSTIIESSYRSEAIESGTIRYLLSDFYKYKANEDIIILYQSKNLHYMFPRRFFASEEDFKTFISYLEASLPTPKR